MTNTVPKGTHLNSKQKQHEVETLWKEKRTALLPIWTRGSTFLSWTGLHKWCSQPCQQDVVSLGARSGALSGLLLWGSSYTLSLLSLYSLQFYFSSYSHHFLLANNYLWYYSWSNDCYGFCPTWTLAEIVFAHVLRRGFIEGPKPGCNLQKEVCKTWGIISSDLPQFLYHTKGLEGESCTMSLNEASSTATIQAQIWNCKAGQARWLVGLGEQGVHATWKYPWRNSDTALKPIKNHSSQVHWPRSCLASSKIPVTPRGRSVKGLLYHNPEQLFSP